MAKRIVREATVGFRGLAVRFYPGDQYVTITNNSISNVGVTMPYTDWRNLIDLACWTDDEYVSREEPDDR